MAFLPYSYDDGQPRPWEYLPAGAITVNVGKTLTQSTGLLAIASNTTKPTYISMIDKVCSSGDIIPVIRVDHGIVFETTNSASFSDAKIGTKVTIENSDSDLTGNAVTATTSSGVAEIIDFDAVAAAGTGGKVLVRF